MLPNLITRRDADAVRHYFLQTKVVLPDGSSIDLKNLPPHTSTVTYSIRSILDNRTIVDLIHTPPILDVVETYLGCPPTVTSLGVRWSFPQGNVLAQTQRFHRDPDDWRFLKLFIYLTDVDEGSGPHTYVAGSHLTAGRLRAKRYELKALNQEFGRTQVRPILGTAGTAFLADTYGIHAGVMPTKQARLILQVQYSLLPIYCFRYEPVSMTSPSTIDICMMRLLVTGCTADPAAETPPI